MRCPSCGGRSIGRVGSVQYYCWDCCVEFNMGRGSIRIFHLDADGELIAAATHEVADEMQMGISATQRR